MTVGVILILAQQKPGNVIFCKTPEVLIPLRSVVCNQICSLFVTVLLVTQYPPYLSFENCEINFIWSLWHHVLAINTW
jgi:hypothetical protein